MKKGEHGVALIINNMEWNKVQGKPLMCTRDAENDGLALKEALKTIGYQVIYKRNLTGEEMRQKLVEMRDKHNIRSSDDSFVCCILSHGGKDGVYGVDKKCVSIQDLSTTLEPDVCRDLVDKPKIFFVQACRGTSTSTAVYDTDEDPQPIHSVPRRADFFVSYATDPGNIALQHDYPQFLSQELVVPNMSLDDIVMEVNKRLAANVPNEDEHQQIGEVVHTMRGRVYFQ